MIDSARFHWESFVDKTVYLRRACTWQLSTRAAKKASAFVKKSLSLLLHRRRCRKGTLVHVPSATWRKYTRYPTSRRVSCFSLLVHGILESIQRYPQPILNVLAALLLFLQQWWPDHFLFFSPHTVSSSILFGTPGRPFFIVYTPIVPALRAFHSYEMLLFQFQRFICSV